MQSCVKHAWRTTKLTYHPSTLSQMKASCISHSNLALIKYWGNRNDALRLPVTNSLSFNLDGASTTTTIEFAEGQPGDEVTLDGVTARGAAALRISAQLDLVRPRAETQLGARVV